MTHSEQQARELIDQLQDLTANPWRWQAWTFFVSAPLSSALWWTWALVDWGSAATSARERVAYCRDRKNEEQAAYNLGRSEALRWAAAVVRGESRIENQGDAVDGPGKRESDHE